MRLDHIASSAVEHLFGRLLRRVLIFAALALFVLIAVYQGSVAGILALQVEYGAIYAHLIFAAGYAALAGVALVTLWIMGRKPAAKAASALSQPREMQIAMLVEAVMLGYALARKGDRAR